MSTISHISAAPTGDAALPEQGKTGLQLHRVIIACMSGTVIEWYDFTLYAVASSLVFGPMFFPGAGRTGAVLASFATFAIGLAVRPIGGLICGHLGDRIGRKPVMLITVLTMGLATTLVGVLPTAASIGAWAPWLLVLLRVVQGLGVGAEFAGAVTMLNETAPAGRRGFASGFASAANYVGTTVATLTFALLSFLPRDIFQSWAWRVPFLATVVVVAVAVYMRTRVQETPEFREAARAETLQRFPLGTVLRTRPRALLATAAIYCFVIPWAYTIQTWGLHYISSDLGLHYGPVLTALVIAYLVLMPAMVLFGMLADRIGIRRTLLIGTIGGMVCAFPIFLLITSRSIVAVTLAMIVALLLSQGLPSAASSVAITRALETEYRWSGIIVCREIPAAVVGGTAPLISVGLLALGHGRPWWIATYLAVLAAIGLAGVLAMPARAYAETDAPS